jgi:hypothetical protein
MVDTTLIKAIYGQALQHDLKMTSQRGGLAAG